MTDLQFTPDERPTMAAFNERFAKVGELYEYWWQASTSISMPVVSEADISPFYLFLASGSDETAQLAYSSTATIDGDAVVLKNPQTIEISLSNYEPAIKAIGGQYFIRAGTKSDGVVYYAGSDIQFYDVVNDGGNSIYGVRVNHVHSVAIAENVTHTESFHSADRSAYPDSGEVDGYEWQYLGVPFDNAITAPKLATGSYIGTGGTETGGVSLTFSFRPRFIAIFNNATPRYFTLATLPESDPTTENRYLTVLTVNSSNSTNTSGKNISYTVEGNTFSTKGTTDAAWGLNTSGASYHYIAIG